MHPSSVATLMCSGFGLATDHGVSGVRPQSRTRTNPPVQEPLRVHTQAVADQQAPRRGMRRRRHARPHRRQKRPGLVEPWSDDDGSNNEKPPHRCVA
ncbi:conserved hypothetical protein [Xanthomonas citri pv. fuscans]|uniref:Uncharacterized protein n=1 Tax=Xanthomonas campestris pv. phaseoli TaxID=317013 RepID=A0A7Z7NH18_XANCH|nr:conserved hypothetical protein [Xanthomonas citri pv. fuscans]SOO24538.1 conserved hypothetical protein [Xanthomonas phaseoli pv. phaseoli]